jgi:tRNA-binding protein
LKKISPSISFDDFSKLDVRTGTIIRAEYFAEARKPAIKLWIDFGSLGIKKSSAQITHRYKAEMLINRQVVAVINFPPKQIANFISECLVLGAINEQNEVVLLHPEFSAVNGGEVK